VPFFFDLSSTFPILTRNPLEPVVVEDEVPVDFDSAKEIPAELIVDTGLPIPSHYDLDVMRLLVQDPFHLYAYWQLKDDPFVRLKRLFPTSEFHSVLKLVDETTNIAVFFDVAFARNYWFSVFPDRAYKVELGVRSDAQGYIKLMTSNAVTTPRGTISNQEDSEPQYQISADEYVQVLRESHLVPERAFTAQGILPIAGSPEEQTEFWEAMPTSFKKLMSIIADVQAGRDYEKLWEKLDQAELTSLIREFLSIVSKMSGDGELGYMLLLRHLPELLRRTLSAEGAIEVSQPMSLYLAEQLGLPLTTTINIGASSEQQVRREQWLPSMKN
jgi:Domain of unknown function (DUF4912)